MSNVPCRQPTKRALIPTAAKYAVVQNIVGQQSQQNNISRGRLVRPFSVYAATEF
ncbi:hypothetical protein ACF8NH_19785 [Providencia sp. TYF_10]|uniref:hypothetical protein n=1 Tax=Providencia sp. TYF_10 TaxID=3367190 RepID=UPI00370AA10A